MHGRFLVIYQVINQCKILCFVDLCSENPQSPNFFQEAPWLLPTVNAVACSRHRTTFALCRLRTGSMCRHASSHHQLSLSTVVLRAQYAPI